MTKRTLGPGAKMMIIAATMYSGRRVGITGSDYAPIHWISPYSQ